MCANVWRNQDGEEALGRDGDRRFYFDRSNLTLFLSVWNAYNRKNIAQYFWNEFERKIEERYQWSVVPVGGLEYEF